MDTKGQQIQSRTDKIERPNENSDFVLDKAIFTNVFEKDIKRVFIYKKAERLAKALHVIAPAFATSVSLKNKLDEISLGLVNAAIQPIGVAKDAFSRELLALSSVLAIARSSGLLSPMNAALISSEAHALLAEVATYEEPRLFFDDSPTLANLAKSASSGGESRGFRKNNPRTKQERDVRNGVSTEESQGEKSQVLDKRTESILSVIKDKGTVYIKDISTVMREISEKTIQRELKRLVDSGIVAKSGERRWTAYSLREIL
jgi:DNA-binding transcriptional ArsR family regulator